MRKFWHWVGGRRKVHGSFEKTFSNRVSSLSTGTTVSQRSNFCHYVLRFGSIEYKIEEPFSEDSIRVGVVRSGLYSDVLSINDLKVSDIVARKLNFLYFLSSSMNQQSFITDPTIRKYFGTTDENALRVIWDILDRTRKAGARTVAVYQRTVSGRSIFVETLISSLSLSDLYLLKPGETLFFHAKPLQLSFHDYEPFQKFMLHLIERELGIYLYFHSMKNNEKLFLSSLLKSLPANSDGLFKVPIIIPNGSDKLFVKRFAERYGYSIPFDLELFEEAYCLALTELKKNAILADHVSTGSDRIFLLMKRRFERIVDDDLHRVANMIYDDLLINGITNSLDEMKANTAYDFHSKFLHTYRRNGSPYIKRLFFMQNDDTIDISKLPVILQKWEEFTKMEKVMQNMGISRLDSLGRDWKNLGASFGISKDDIFKCDAMINSNNIFEQMTEMMKDAMALAIFGKKTFNQLTLVQKQHIQQLAEALGTKMENSIAQHQMLEYMRTGRWIEINNLGYDLPLENALENVDVTTNDVLQEAIEGMDGNIFPIVPVVLDGEKYNLILAKNTLFDYFQSDIDSRFGFQFYKDDNGLVQKLPNKLIDIFSIRVNEKIKATFDKVRADNIDSEEISFFSRDLRSMQNMVFDEIFRRRGQGHLSNFINGEFCPEIMNLVTAYGGKIKIKETTMKNTAATVRWFDGHLNFNPNTVYHKIVRVKAKANVKLTRIIRTLNFDNSFIRMESPTVSKPEGLICQIPQIPYRGDQIKLPPNIEWDHLDYFGMGIRNIIDLFEKTMEKSEFNRLLSQINYREEIRSDGKVYPKKDDDILKEYTKAMSPDVVLAIFAQVPRGLQGESSKVIDLSPLDSVTTLIATNRRVNVPILDWVFLTDENENVYGFLDYPYPVLVGKNTRSFFSNEPVKPKAVKALIKKYESYTKFTISQVKNAILGKHFEFMSQFFDKRTIDHFAVLGNGNPIEGMIKEFWDMGYDIMPKIKIELKPEFEHLANVIFIKETKDTPATVRNIRIFPGHFPGDPTSFNVITAGFTPLYSNRIPVYRNYGEYVKEMPKWAELRIRQALHTLTLDKDAFLSNYLFWRETKIGRSDAKFKDYFSEEALLALSAQFLAPIANIRYTQNGFEVVQTTTAGAWEKSILLTPIFLDDEILNNFHILIQNFPGLENAGFHDLFVDAVRLKRTTYENVANSFVEYNKKPFRSVTWILLSDMFHKIVSDMRILLVTAKRI